MATERIGRYAIKLIEETAAARDKALAAADSLIAERDELRAVLREILEEECIPPGFSVLIERAEKLLENN